MKVLTVFGTRPEAIKIAPVLLELNKHSSIESLVCVTGQHREMLDSVLSLFGIEPDFDLEVMRPNQNLTKMTAEIIRSFGEILIHVKPDILLLHGDTTTALASSVVAFYERVPIGHIEAGLRTNDINSPFPEEFNRQIISKSASIHFCPTQSSKENLLREGFDPKSLVITGNTVIDSMMWVVDRLNRNAPIAQEMRMYFERLLNFPIEKVQYILITGHRRENFGSGFFEICAALKDLATKWPALQFIYPVHLNPNVLTPVTNMLQGISNIHLIEPLDYEKFIYLMRYSYLVLTDSGGIQEEAPSLGKPVLVMRSSTERPEAVIANTVRLVGANRGMIFSGVELLLNDHAEYKKMSMAHNPYGDGTASKKIIKALLER